MYKLTILGTAGVTYPGGTYPSYPEALEAVERFVARGYARTSLRITPSLIRIT